MAGDWIKMRADLLTSPKVVRIASALRADRLRVIGALHAVWCLFDVHSEDGTLDSYTPEVLDELIGWAGFSQAMASVHWLEIGDGFLSVPRFDEHNGQSAKRRATEAERKRNARAQASASDADKKRTREEKRREEEKEEPSGSSVGASATATKRAARKCPDSFVVTPDLIAWAASEAPGVSLETETAKLRDYTFKNAISDWQGAWRNWMRRAQQDLSQRRTQQPQASFAERDAEAKRARIASMTGGILGSKPRDLNTIDMEEAHGTAKLLG